MNLLSGLAGCVLTGAAGFTGDAAKLLVLVLLTANEADVWGLGVGVGVEVGVGAVVGVVVGFGVGVVV